MHKCWPFISLEMHLIIMSMHAQILSFYKLRNAFNNNEHACTNVRNAFNNNEHACSFRADISWSVCVVRQSLDEAVNRSQEFSWNPTVRSRSLPVRSDPIIFCCFCVCVSSHLIILGELLVFKRANVFISNVWRTTHLSFLKLRL